MPDDSRLRGRHVGTRPSGAPQAHASGTTACEPISTTTLGPSPPVGSSLMVGRLLRRSSQRVRDSTLRGDFSPLTRCRSGLIRHDCYTQRLQARWRSFRPLLTVDLLMLRSLKGVYKASAVGTVFRLGTSPDPGPGAGVELGGGHPGGAGDLVGVGEFLSGQRLAPEDPPPAFLEVQPAGALGDEGVPDPGIRAPDIAAWLRVVAGLPIWSFIPFPACRCLFPRLVSAKIDERFAAAD